MQPSSMRLSAAPTEQEQLRELIIRHMINNRWGITRQQVLTAVLLYCTMLAHEPARSWPRACTGRPGWAVGYGDSTCTGMALPRSFSITLAQLLRITYTGVYLVWKLPGCMHTAADEAIGCQRVGLGCARN